MSCETLTAPPVPVPAGPADTPAPTSSAAPPPAPSLTAWGLGVLLVAYAPVNFTFGSVNVLADAIGRDLRADAAGQQLVLAAYTTAFAATLVIAGRLGDRWGRRRLLLLGGLGVAVISIATAFAPGLTSAVALRVLLGIAAGLLTPQVLATIQSTSSGTARTRGLMLFVAVSGASTVVGQIVAGAVAHALPEHLGWRAVQILTGLIALTAVAGLRTVPRTRSSAPLSLDAIGASVLGASLLLIVVPLTLGRSLGWPSWTVVSLLIGVALLAAFWALQRRSERRGAVPVVPPAVLRLTTVRRGLLMTLLFFTTYGAFLYELSAFAQLRYSLGTLGPALLVLGFGIAFIAASLALPRLIPAAGELTMASAGIAQAVLLAAIALLVATGHHDIASLQWALIPLGIAQALMFGPVLQTVLSRTPQWAAGVSSGLFATVQQLGLTLGVALLGGLFWTLAGPEQEHLEHALVTVFWIHVVCALLFVALAHSLRAHRETAPTAA
ncbi:MAG: MFS transporter [Brachybacterium tyrofermentans]